MLGAPRSFSLMLQVGSARPRVRDHALAAAIVGGFAAYAAISRGGSVLLTSAPEAGASRPFRRRAVQPQLAATRAQGVIAVDGTLDEADWTRAAVAASFIQAEPRQGEPATEPTEVRVLFDDRHLYVGVVCMDSRGGDDLRVRDLRRDFDDTTDDFFGVAIDGVRDGRSAMIFRVNPRGALRDQQNVDGGLADVDFDAVWTARTSRDRAGLDGGDRDPLEYACATGPAAIAGTSTSSA